jgi:hypothetical protein
MLSLSILAFADTIRLKDGSIIKGKIINFSGGRFTVAVGEGTRQRQMTFSADEIESIVFDSPQTPATNVKISNPAENNSVDDDKIITVGENPRTSVPTVPPQIIKTDNTVPSASQQNQSAAQNQNTAQNQNPVQTQPSKPAVNPPATTNAAAPKPIQLSVKVLADNTANGWTNSGWVVKKGQKIRIAADGRVSLGSGRFTPPSGISSLPDNDKLMKAVPTGALIAVIGDDNNDFIYVGTEREFVAARDGSLFLGVNEGNLNDNSGAFDVTIEIFPN